MAEKDIAEIYKTPEIKTNLTQTIPKDWKKRLCQNLFYGARINQTPSYIKTYRKSSIQTSISDEHIYKNCQQNPVKPILTAHQKYQTSWSGRVYPRDARTFLQINKGSASGTVWICNVLHTLMIWTLITTDGYTICGGCRNQEVTTWRKPVTGERVLVNMHLWLLPKTFCFLVSHEIKQLSSASHFHYHNVLPKFVRPNSYGPNYLKP